MKAYPAKIALMMAICLMVAACGSSKDSNSSPAAAPAKVEAPAVPPEAPPVDPAAADRSKDTDNTKNIEPQDNSGAQVGFEETFSEQEIENMINEGRRYSGSADDGLREYLLEKMEQESDQVQRARNLKFAFSTVSVKLKKVGNTPRLQLSIKILETGKEKAKDRERMLTFSGALSTQKKGSNRLDLVSTDKSGKVRKEQKAVLICMDEKKPRMIDCQTKVAQVYLNKAYLQIILRKAVARIHGEFPNIKCRTQECENVYGLLKNTMDGVSDANSVQSSTMETFEVIQGKSAFNAIVISKGGEVLKFAGPLASPEHYPELDTELDRKLTSDERIDSETKKIYKTNMNDSLNDVRIQRNDGQGKVRIKVRMKVNPENGTRDMFDIELNRQMKPIRALLDAQSRDLKNLDFRFFK